MILYLHFGRAWNKGCLSTVVSDGNEEQHDRHVAFKVFLK